MPFISQETRFYFSFCYGILTLQIIHNNSGKQSKYYLFCAVLCRIVTFRIVYITRNLFPLFFYLQAFLFNIRHIVCDNESSNRYTNPKIYWELNWLNQWDEKLILFIKQNLLIPPPSIKGVNLVNAWDSHEPWKYHQGQNGQALLVEHLYELETYSSR